MNLLLRIAAAGLAAGASAGFVLSRTTGLFGFSERGFQPAPKALLSVVAEVAVVVLVAVALHRDGFRWRAAARTEKMPS
ncbi:hypothetical protein [Amycolatopsis sp. CA-126428]|uniref:hypothetical protein n=1 Tax=Amycolatopsis sp. CA-126428 TaxID=2073158 RepID=UPI000CD3138D|nr:hypothetical protein [Amycolatopsis sp. CA-126428]